MDATFEVSLPDSFVNAVLDEHRPRPAVPPHPVDTAGAFADVAQYAPLLATEGAVTVTLLQTPATLRALARAFAGRRKPRSEAYWLRVRGPVAK